MYTEVAICNQALSLCGANLITSLDDDSVEARVCKINYQYLRDSVLEAAEWSFAIKRATLARLAETPVYGFSYMFLLPSDSVRLLNVIADDREDEWVLEGDKILSNSKSISIRYIRRVIDPARFSPNFAQSLAYRLAAEISIPLVESRSLQEQLYSIFVKQITEAVNMDNMQGVKEKYGYTSLLRARV
jgi:hypothetical protein